MSLSSLGRVGIWTNALDAAPATTVRDAAAELDALGYGALWTGESFGRDIVSACQLLLAATERIAIGAGIASIWARDPFAAVAAQESLHEAYDGRFVLGLGVSHAPLVGMRDQAYGAPLAAMTDYLDGMERGRAQFRGVRAEPAPLTVLAALGPKMLALAAAKAGGAHTYFVPVAHTALARSALGPRSVLAPEQAVVLESDPSRARAIARKHTSFYLRLDNYAANLRRLGFSDDELADGGSDRVVDALVAWGDETAIARRVIEHWEAGADHVAVQVLTEDRGTLPREQWQRLAPVLTAL